MRAAEGEGHAGPACYLGVAQRQKVSMMGRVCPWLIPSRTSCQNTDILPYQSANSCCPEQPKYPPLAPGPPAGFSQSPLPHTAANGITAGMAGSPGACLCCCPGPFWRVSAYAVPGRVNLWGSAWPQCQMSAPCGDSHALSSPCQQIFIHTYSVPGPGAVSYTHLTLPTSLRV